MFVLPSLHDGWGGRGQPGAGRGIARLSVQAPWAAAADSGVRNRTGLRRSPADVAGPAPRALRRLFADRRELRSASILGLPSLSDHLPSRGVDRWVELAEHASKRRIPAAAQPLSIDPVDS